MTFKIIYDQYNWNEIQDSIYSKTSTDVKIAFSAQDVLPGKHIARIKIIDNKLQTVTEIVKEIDVK